MTRQRTISLVEQEAHASVGESHLPRGFATRGRGDEIHARLLLAFLVYTVTVEAIAFFFFSFLQTSYCICLFGERVSKV